MNISEAELAIAAILAKLEDATGDWVEAVNVVSVETTTLKDERPQYVRRVQIQLKAKPGSNWATSR